jgi:phosphoglycerate dehydrogenase-like enzyme
MPERPIIVFLDDLERAARRCADWSRLESMAELRFLSAPLRGTALLEALQPAHAVALMRDRTPMPAQLLDQLPNLKYLVFTGNRNDTLDLQALRARGVPVSCTRFGPSRANTCELAWALILAAVKHLPQADHGLRAGQWRPPGALPSLLHGERIGLIGLGAIGARMADIAQAFGMEVVTWSPHMTMARAAARDATAVSLDELVQTSKVISVHLVASETTRQLFDAGRFARMRSDALFVNTSHADLVDTAALVAALRAGRPGAAALDVFDTEPLAPDHALLQLPNVVLTPHLGFVCQQVFEQFYADVAESLLAWLEQRPLLHEVWSPQAA